MRGKVECDLFGCRIIYMETHYESKPQAKTRPIKYGNYKIRRTVRVVAVLDEQQPMAFMFGGKFVNFELQNDKARILDAEPTSKRR